MTKLVTFFHYSAVDPTKLSLLSDGELRLIAERMGIYIPENLDRVFIIEEIIEALEEESSERAFSHDAPGHVEEKKLTGAGFIPGRLEDIEIPEYYNETYIRILVRDPLWIFAYWDVSQSMKEKILEEFIEPKLFLRVNEVFPKDEIKEERNPKSSFHYDISVHFEDRKWYINVPEPNRYYKVDLCIASVHKTKILAHSNVVRVPLHYIQGSPKLPQMTKSLLVLSGSEELQVMEPHKDSSVRILSADGE